MNKSYMNYLKSDSTRKIYTTCLTRFFDTVDKPETEVTFMDVVDYQQTLTGSGVASNTIRTHIAALRSYFGFLQKAHMIDTNPVDGIAKPRPNPKLKEYVSMEDVQKMVESARTSRDKAIIKLLVSTGLRVHEMSEITKAEYMEAIHGNRQITILGKGNKFRKIYIAESIEEAINQYLTDFHRMESYDTCPYLFATFRGNQIDAESLSKTLKTTARNAGLPYWKDISNHWLRAAFATIANEKGINTYTISKAMGHSNINTTMIYIKNNQNSINQAMSAMAI